MNKILYKKYQYYINSYEWRKKRELKLNEIKNCEICGVGDKLNVHHKHYETLFNESLDDLSVLCVVCHGDLHGRTFVHNEFEGCKKAESRDAKRKSGKVVRIFFSDFENIISSCYSFESIDFAIKNSKYLKVKRGKVCMDSRDSMEQRFISIDESLINIANLNSKFDVMAICICSYIKTFITSIPIQINRVLEVFNCDQKFILSLDGKFGLRIEKFYSEAKLRNRVKKIEKYYVHYDGF